MTSPGVILFHGVGDDGACWAPFLESLALPELVVVTPDAPAHGSRLVGPGATVAWQDLLAEGLAQTESLAQATGGPVVMGGHSMGSATALGVAATRPDLAAALFLEDPPFAGSMPANPIEPGVDLMDRSESLLDWFRGLQSANLAQVTAGARAEHPGWPDDEYEPWARAKMAVDTSAFVEPMPFVGRGWTSLAPRVRCPAVVVAGHPERGSLLAAESATALSALPGWSVHRLPAGHDVRRDARRRTGSVLRKLLVDAAR